MKTLILILFLATSCAGVLRSADPVDPYEYGDEQKTCEELKVELDLSKERLEKLDNLRNAKIVKNAVFGTTGALLFFPLLFLMDVSDVDVINIRAEESRYESLSEITGHKSCDFEVEPIEKLETYTADRTTTVDNK